MMDDLEVAELAGHDNLEDVKEPYINNDEGEDSFDDDDDDQSEEDEEEGEDGGIEKWIDVKDLKNMSLEELKTFHNSTSENDDKKLDLPITKVVVRRLPPQITVEDYLQELSEVPAYNYIRLVPPNDDLPSRIGKRSSIYINFDTEQEAFWFKEKYNNMKFFDERGNSYIACVDFSFIQDVAQDPPDEPQMGTLEESEMYQAFLKAYEEEPWSFTMNRPDHIPTPEAMLDEILNKKTIEPESTPLLQFLRDRSVKKDAVRKEREQRRKERDLIRRKQKEEMLKRRQKEKDEAAKRKIKEKEELVKRKPNDRDRERDEVKDREKEHQNAKDRRRERDRERQRDRDRERRLRKEKERLERDPTSKNKDDQTEKPAQGQGDKESVKQKSEKDKDSKTGKPFASGNITYSKSGNPTRWSENSGPRKGDKLKDELKRSQEKLSQTKNSSSTEKLAVEKSSSSNPPSSSKTKDISKPTFGKPFPTKSDTNNASEESSNKGKKEEESGNSTKPDSNGSDGTKKDGNADVPITKKRVIKRVIKVRKVKDGTGVENADDIASSQQSGSSDAKPKKVVRVVRKSTKGEDGGGSSKTESEGASKKVDTEKGSSGDGDKMDSKDADKERKNKRGRPEIQIYRPGSLRGAPKLAPSAGEKDKERKSDNN